MSKRRKIIIEAEIADLMRNISESESDYESSDSDTDIYSGDSTGAETDELSDHGNISDISHPSTSKGNTSPWSSEIGNLIQLPFGASCELKVDNAVSSKIDFFRRFFDESVMNLITEQTNAYEKRKNLESEPGSSTNYFLPVTEEIFLFISLTLLMDIIKKPKIKVFFNKSYDCNSHLQQSNESRLCESESGYIWNFIVYAGKETVLKEVML